MKYDKDNTKQYKINDIPVVLLTEPIDANLMTWYPDSFLANTEINQSTSFLTMNDSFSEILHAQKGSRENPPQEMDDVETKNQQQIQEFFRLDTEQIEDLQINSFLQECHLAKTKYFQGIQTSSFSVQPKTLTEIIQSDLDKKKYHSRYRPGKSCLKNLQFTPTFTITVKWYFYGL